MSSPFTSLVTETVPIPHDDGQSAVIRKLAPKHLQAAAKASQRRAVEDLRAIGGPTFLKELQSLSTEDKSRITDDPLLRYDWGLLLEHGIVSWTYGDVSRERIEDLDDDVQEALAKAVLRLAKPSLFQTIEEREAAQKND